MKDFLLTQSSRAAENRATSATVPSVPGVPAVSPSCKLSATLPLRHSALKKTGLALALAFLCNGIANALPLAWRADWPDCKPVEKLVHRGTDVELLPAWYIYGTPAASTNWTLTTYVQTNCVGQWFGPLPGAFFSHSNDVGAASYGVMVRAEAPDGSVNYTAFARLRMLDSPGYTPGALPLPVPVLDFADVAVLNPPWPAAIASATNSLDQSWSSRLSSATNALDQSWSSRLSQVSRSSTNYTDSATNALNSSWSSSLSQVSRSSTNYTDSAIAAASTNYYTIAETDDAIDALAAYYITANADGDAFATVAALTNATAYYSGGALRTPTRNDYAVVLADESHGGAEWRYIYAVHEGATTGQWEAQYPIETNDYEALANKPSINSVELSGNQSAAQLGLATTNDATLTPVYPPPGTGFSDWTIYREGSNVTAQVERPLIWYDDGYVIGWDFELTYIPGDLYDMSVVPPITGAYDSLSISYTGWDGNMETVHYTATRTRTAPIGYTLGSQTNKVLASTNNIASATNALNSSWSSRLSQESRSSTNYTDNATNALNSSWSSRLSQVSRSSTNYTDHAISTADTSYPRFTTATNLNQSVQYLTSAPSNVLAIQLPAGSAATKDWIVYAYFGAETALALPAANWWMADEAYTNAIPASTPTAFYFSQVANGIYTISRQELKTITITNP